MKDSTKKILATISTFCVMAGAAVGIYFAVTKNNQQVQNPNSGTTVVTPDPSPNPNPDPSPSPNPNPDPTPTPPKPDEKTELDYMKECEERIQQIALEKLQSTSKRATFGNVKIVKINELDGTVYLTADRKIDSTKKYFYILYLGKPFTQTTYQEAVEVLNEISPINTNLETQTILKGKISEELYNKLTTYILSEVGLEGAEILNATAFNSNEQARNETNLTLIKNDKIYNVKAITSSFGSQEDHANYMLNSKTNTISITNEENFKEFVTQSTAEASAENNLAIFDITFPVFETEAKASKGKKEKQKTKTFRVVQENGKADYRGFSI